MLYKILIPFKSTIEQLHEHEQIQQREQNHRSSQNGIR